MNPGKIGGLVRGLQFSNFSQHGLARGGLGEQFEKFWPKQKLIRNLCKIDGPDKGHHFFNLSQHGLARGGLGAIFGKVMPRRKP